MKFRDKLKVKLLGYRATSESYISHLRKIGVKIGEDVVLFRPLNTTIDIQNPHLLEIGSHVMITGPVTILTHDYSWSVLKKVYGEILGNQKCTVLKDNVFVGWGATILAGSYVGKNSIIGAGSIVSGHLEGNAIYAGNPARKIMSLDEYYRKRKSKQLEEAVDYVKKYEDRFGCGPPIEKMDEYFYLFFDPMDKEQKEIFDYKLHLMGNYDECIGKSNDLAKFKNYEEFIYFCHKH